jgi:hypothetical protein
MIMEIKLTQGLSVIIDACDYEKVSQYKWHAEFLGNNNYCYARTKTKDGRILMHRLISGAKKGDIVDHANHLTLDNRRENIRICTRQQNAINRNSHKLSSSKYKGVHFEKETSKWSATIKTNNKSKRIGRFNTEEEAAIAYDQYARKIHGEFVCLNFPEENEQSALMNVSYHPTKRKQSSDHKGVCFHKQKGKYTARVTDKDSKKRISIGLFANEIDAVYAIERYKNKPEVCNA